VPPAQRGHAIECRVYAEDPGAGFLPQAGRLLRYQEPRGPGVRVDAGVIEGGDVPVMYDPLLAKLTVHADSRRTAIERAVAALQSYVVLGIRTNIPFLVKLLRHPDFAAGSVHTGFIDQHVEQLAAVPEPDRAIVAAAAVADRAPLPSPATGAAAPAPADPWTTLAGWGR
jgi:acetyl/propionyl-CoA carboxylase alpha subunit